MYLFDNNTAHEWPAVEAEVRRLCERIDADLQVCVKFDERKLAYEINGHKRGTYVLTYFNAEPERIADLERDARLSEHIMRALVLRSELSEEELAKLKAHPADTPLSPLASDSRRGDRDDRGRGERRSRGDRREKREPKPEDSSAGAADKDAEPAAASTTEPTAE
ncbi:MAG: 30S ribosomal protein S6 [Planctomycetota bacterium]|nr:MAG: 30S ribosomal protein S6 [Planctomycetota bacterium]